MARITVEDCEKVVPNRFDLVILAAQRTRQILDGNMITIPNKDDEKKTVLALREIGAQTISTEALKDCAIKSFRTISAEEDLLEDFDDITDEEDTYNPYAALEIKSIETDQIATAKSFSEFTDVEPDIDNGNDKDLDSEIDLLSTNNDEAYDLETEENILSGQSEKTNSL